VGKFAASIEHPTAESVSALGGYAPDPLTRNSVRGPCWGPIIGWRSRNRHRTSHLYWGVSNSLAPALEFSYNDFRFCCAAIKIARASGFAAAFLRAPKYAFRHRSQHKMIHWLSRSCSLI